MSLLGKITLTPMMFIVIFISSWLLTLMDLLLKLTKVADPLYSHSLTSKRRVDFGVRMLYIAVCVCHILWTGMTYLSLVWTSFDFWIISSDFEDLKFSSHGKASVFNYTNAGDTCNFQILGSSRVFVM